MDLDFYRDRRKALVFLTTLSWKLRKMLDLIFHGAPLPVFLPGEPKYSNLSIKKATCNRLRVNA